MSAINSWIVADPPATRPAVKMMSVNCNTACCNDASAPPNSKIGPRSRIPDNDTIIPSVKPTRSARLWVPALYSCSLFLASALPLLFCRSRLLLETRFPALAPCLDESFKRAFDEQGNDVEDSQLDERDPKRRCSFPHLDRRQRITLDKDDHSQRQD